MRNPVDIDVDSPIPYVLSPWKSDSWRYIDTCCCRLEIQHELVVCIDCGTIYMEYCALREWVESVT